MAQLISLSACHQQKSGNVTPTILSQVTTLESWKKPSKFEYTYISSYLVLANSSLTHWGRVTDICVSKLNAVVSDNGLSPEWHQDIIWTNAGILLIGTSGTNFSEILSQIHTFSSKKMHLKTSAKWRPFCLGLDVLIFFTNVQFCNHRFDNCVAENCAWMFFTDMSLHQSCADAFPNFF